MVDSKAYAYSGICCNCEKGFMGYKREQVCHACVLANRDARIAELETALIQSCNAARLYGYQNQAPMMDALRVRQSIEQ